MVGIKVNFVWVPDWAGEDLFLSDYCLTESADGHPLIVSNRLFWNLKHKSAKSTRLFLVLLPHTPHNFNVEAGFFL